jgi:competence protein ComEC
MRLQAAGTYHVIAISGGNIAILAAVILIVFAALGIHNRYGAIVAIVVLVTYAQIVSAGPSVWRATLMAILYFGARLFDHRTPSWYAMTLAAAIIAVAQPLDVRDAGFLLTFGATAGLLGAARFIAVRLPRHRVIAWVFGSVVASLAVEVVLVPVSAGVFSRVTAAGLLLNLVAVPAMALVQIAGMVVVVCDRFPPIAASSGWLAAQGAFALIDSAWLIDVAPALVQRVPPPPAWIIAIYYVALVLAWRGSRRSRALPIIVLVSTGVLIFTGRDPFAATRPTDRLRVTTIDVGQGESILLDAPGVEPMLVDTGGSPFGGGAFDIGRRVLAPVLWKQGVRRLGALLVTHGDPDHLGGAEAVLADFQPRSLWWGTPVPPHEPSRQLLGTAHRQGSVVAFRRAGDTLAYGRAHIRILHPPPPDWERQKVRNDDSVVLEVVYGDVAILLTGDISSTVERQIAPQLTPARVRVLKVAHHGSRTSSSTELLDAWRPQIAVISCGRGNTFGHPAPEVLTRLQSIGARVYRTDRDGEITLESDGESVSVTTFTAERR